MKGLIYFLIIASQTIFITILLVVLALSAFGITLKINEVYTNCSNEDNKDVEYEDNAEYCVRVLDRQKLFSKDRELWITHAQVTDVGFMMYFPDSEDHSESELEDEVTVYWSKDGVKVTTDSAEMFITKEKFVGGR